MTWKSTDKKCYGTLLNSIVWKRRCTKVRKRGQLCNQWIASRQVYQTSSNIAIYTRQSKMSTRIPSTQRITWLLMENWCLKESRRALPVIWVGYNRKLKTKVGWPSSFKEKTKISIRWIKYILNAQISRLRVACLKPKKQTTHKIPSLTKNLRIGNIGQSTQEVFKFPKLRLRKLKTQLKLT